MKLTEDLSHLSNEEFNLWFDKALAEQLKEHVWGKQRAAKTTASLGTLVVINRLNGARIK